ncbi:MAG: metal-sulfur cluster assembly factor [bacterium]|nr:metal-sulfur cluster assembly factor [bacterium]
MKPTIKQIKKQLYQVMDPELGISIVDLGLIYKITINKTNKINILMTLTTMGCPLISVIEQEIKNRLQELGIKEKNITIELIFEPPWSMDKMSPSAKAMLGI